MDSSTGDYAIYVECCKLLVIHPNGDKRLFMIKSQDDEINGPRLIFRIDDRNCHGCEFEYELNHPKTIVSDDKKLYKKV